MENKEWMFTWKSYLFVALIDASKIFLKWTPLIRPREAFDFLQAKNQLNILNSPEQMDKDDMSPVTITFDLDNEKEFRYLTCGFSYDPGCLDTVPVIVLLGSNLELQKHKEDERNFVCILLSVKIKTLDSRALDSEVPTYFEFVNLGTYDLTQKQMNTFFHQDSFAKNNFKVLPFFGMLYLETQAAKLDIFSAKSVSSYTLFESEECCNYKKFTLLDIFCTNMSQETFLLFSYMDGNGVKRARGIKFLFCNCQSQPEGSSVKESASHSPLEVVHQKYLFAKDYSQLIVAVKLISLSSGQKQSPNESMHYMSSMAIITTTGYLLYFVDGNMTSCIHMWSDIQEICNFTAPEWTSAIFNIVAMSKGSSKKIAVQVNSTCVLLDTETEKTIKVWQPASFIAKVTNNSAPCFFMVMNSADSGNKSLWNLCEDRANIHVIDCFRTNSKGEFMESDWQRQISEESSRSENQIPQFAVDAILEQKKKYENAVKEMEIELAAKEKFFVETLETLQNFSATLATSQKSLQKDPRLIPLSEDAQGSNKEKACNKVQAQHSKHKFKKSDIFRSSHQICNILPHIQVLGEPWKRTIDSLLVVGLLIKNVSERPIGEAHIYLIPAKACSFSMLECVSGEGSSTVENSWISSFLSSSSIEGSTNIQPGDERTLTCFVDTGQLFSPADCRFSLITNFSMNNPSTRKENILHEQRQDKEVFNISCGDVILSCNDVISAKYALEGIIGNKVSEPSELAVCMSALDCVQRATTFVVKSEISSALCLESKLKSNDNFLNTCQCSIFVTDHQLRLCRVKVLQQVKKKEGKVQILTRTESQTVLMVKFLHSILPDDVMLLPYLPTPSLGLQQVQKVLDKELRNRISEIKAELSGTVLNQPVELSIQETKMDSGQPSLTSPTFHSKINVLNTSGPKTSSKISDGGDEKIPKGKVDSDRFSDERKKKCKAKRKPNEKFGLTDSE